MYLTRLPTYQRDNSHWTSERPPSLGLFRAHQNVLHKPPVIRPDQNVVDNLPQSAAHESANAREFFANFFPALFAVIARNYLLSDFLHLNVRESSGAKPFAILSCCPKIFFWHFPCSARHADYCVIDDAA